MHLRILVVVILAAVFAAGLGYGLLKLKDRNVAGAEPVEQAVRFEVPPPAVAGAVPPVSAQVPQMPQPVPAQGPQPPISAPPVPPAANVPNPTAFSAPPLPPASTSLPSNFVLSPSSSHLEMLGLPPHAVMEVSQIPPNSSPLPPDALLTMAVEDRKTYFEFLIKPTAAQKELMTKYFSALGQVEMKNRELIMRMVRLSNFYANAQQPNQVAAPQVMPPSQIVLSLEEQQTENAFQQEQIKQALAARAALIKSLSKEQATKIKAYTEAKVY